MTSKTAHKITLKDFKTKGEGAALWFVYDLRDGGELCLEPCLNGFCIGMYDKRKMYVMTRKICTNLVGKNLKFSMMKAIAVANLMLNDPFPDAEWRKNYYQK